MAGSSGLRPAKVVAVHNGGRAVDIVFLDTGARAAWVQVLSFDASTNSGESGLAEPTAPETDYSPQDTNERDIFAVTGFVGGVPVVLGFLYPQVCQMLFDEANRWLKRHPSDVYATLNDAGDYEFFHPSGTFIRIAEDPAHEDLTAKDFDKKFKIDRNTDKAVHVHLSVRNAGDEVASVDIAPTGDIVITTTGDLTANVEGDANLAVTGDITSSANAWNHTGDFTVTGTITGSVTVIGGGKNLKTHVHSGVQSGGSNTGQPV